MTAPDPLPAAPLPVPGGVLLPGTGGYRVLADGDAAEERVTVTHPALPADGAFRAGFRTRLRDAGRGGGGVGRRGAEPGTGVVTAGSGGRTSRVFFSRADGILVQYVTGVGARVRVDLDHRVDGVPPGLDTGRGVVAGRRTALLTLRVRHPGTVTGHTVLALVVADAGRTAVTDRGVRVEGAGRLLLLTRALRHDGPGDPAGEAVLRDLAGEDGPAAAYGRLLGRHTAHRA
ncbi:hypothetical protein [Streptomyces termitum]|uniref:hypothetical protein n=1 Tax=Streptomyces termitum TaxID=67368 RepID=UPI0033BCD113